MLISPGAGAARTSEHTVARAGAHWGGGGDSAGLTPCVAWRGEVEMGHDRGIVAPPALLSPLLSATYRTRA